MDDLIAWYPFSRDAAIASVRLRCFNPLEELRRRGRQVEFYRKRHYTRYKLVVFSKNYTQQALQEAGRLRRNGAKLVFDLCDNHFYNPNRLPEWTKNAARLRQIISMMDHVVVSTDSLADVVRQEINAQMPITVIEDPLEKKPRVTTKSFFTFALTLPRRLASFLALRALKRKGATGIVWFGNHGSPYADQGGMTDVMRVRAFLHDLHRKRPLFMTIVSNNRNKFDSSFLDWEIPVFYFEWNPVDFRFLLQQHDVCIIPATENAFTRCKTNNRLVLALDAGLAVVADTIPSYQEFSDFCVLGDWNSGLYRYVTDPALRADDVSRGRERVRNGWTLDRIAAKWAELFDELTKHGRHV